MAVESDKGRDGGEIFGGSRAKTDGDAGGVSRKVMREGWRDGREGDWGAEKGVGGQGHGPISAHMADCGHGLWVAGRWIGCQGAKTPPVWADRNVV